MAAFVYAAFATTGRASRGLAVCSCAQGAGGRRSSAAVATAARCTAAPSAHGKRARRHSMPPRSATRGVLVASGAGPTAHAAIGAGKEKWSRIRVHPRRRRVICCRPTRWRCLATTLSRPSRPGGRWRTVIGAVVPACRCFARGFCAVVVAVVAVLDPPERSAMPHGDPTRHRGADPALLPRREMEDRHHRRPVARASCRGDTCAGAGGPAPARPAAAAIEGGCVSAVHPADAGKVPDPDSQPAARNGARARLPRRPGSLSPPRCLPPSASSGRGVSAAAQPAWRTEPGGLGALRPSGDRPRAASADGVRDGAEPFPADLPALLP